MAVDDSAKAKAPIKLACQVQPRAQPTAPTAAAHTPICAVPPPKTMPRMAHRRWGSSSKPMTNSMSTTPSSETWSMACGSLTSPSAMGPMTTPASR